jgi:hypothetical protein
MLPFFKASYTVAAPKVMSPNRKLNYTAADIPTPINNAPAMEAKLRLTPGHRDAHCNRPTPNA